MVHLPVGGVHPCLSHMCTWTSLTKESLDIYVLTNTCNIMEMKNDIEQALVMSIYTVGAKPGSYNRP